MQRLRFYVDEKKGNHLNAICYKKRKSSLGDGVEAYQLNDFLSRSHLILHEQRIMAYEARH